MLKNIIFFDTETTGNSTDDFLCQLAYKLTNLNGEECEIFENLYKPKKEIPPEASAVHHITNKMVLDKKKFQESNEYQKIKSIFENQENIIIAHNALFDIMMIQKENINPKKFICTLRVARNLHTEEKIERYNLQYLRYYLQIEINAKAHDALGDVLVLEKLFERMKNKIMEKEKLNQEEAINKMIEISSKPFLFQRINFGKYNGKKIEDILEQDKGYLDWLLKQKLNSETNEEDWIYTLKYYLGKN